MLEVRRGMACPAIPPLYSPCSAFSSFFLWVFFVTRLPVTHAALQKVLDVLFFFFPPVRHHNLRGITNRCNPSPLLHVTHHTQPAAAFIIRTQMMANRSLCCNCSHNHNPGRDGGATTHILLCVLRRFDSETRVKEDLSIMSQRQVLCLCFPVKLHFCFLKNGLRPYDTSPRCCCCCTSLLITTAVSFDDVAHERCRPCSKCSKLNVFLPLSWNDSCEDSPLVERFFFFVLASVFFLLSG